MAEKFNAKNLSYNSALPPFLAALRAQNPSLGSGAADPLLAANRRHRAKRSGSAEAEDGPVVVDAEGNVVEARLEGDGTVKYEGGAEGGEDEGEESDGGKKAEKAGLVGRKRKARVVGAGQEEDDEPAAKSGKRADGGKVEKVKNEKKDKDEEADELTSQSKKRVKGKKAKKIKLSFDEET